jgi:hypothetical protein
MVMPLHVLWSHFFCCSSQLFIWYRMLLPLFGCIIIFP